MEINPSKKILHLTLKKKWFDLIKSGEKKLEFREIKPYWTKRLFNEDGSHKYFDVILFRNGYQKDSPKMLIDYLGVQATMQFQGKECYAILLGKILEVKG